MKYELNRKQNLAHVVTSENINNRNGFCMPHENHRDAMAGGQRRHLLPTQAEVSLHAVTL